MKAHGTSKGQSRDVPPALTMAPWSWAIKTGRADQANRTREPGQAQVLMEELGGQLRPLLPLPVYSVAGKERMLFLLSIFPGVLRFIKLVQRKENTLHFHSSSSWLGTK